MKKFIAVFAIAASLVACDNAANSERSAKDSLDSIASAEKNMNDSTNEVKNEMIDSATQVQKEAVDKIDSMNMKKDSVMK